MKMLDCRQEFETIMKIEKMAEDGEIDIEGDFDFKLEANSDVYDTNELPSKSANLLPEYTNPAWMLEQGWTMDNYIDEKSKATIEKMLQEEQYYLNGQNRRRNIRNLSSTTHKQPWSEDEKNLFLKGLEIYGRSWSKIAELIPSRTNLQVKNFAQQYFKQQTKSSRNQTTNEITQEHGNNKQPVTMEQVLKTVTTAQPTISVPTMTKSADHVISQSFDHKTLSVKKKVTALNTEVKTIKTNEMLSIDTVGIENKTQQDNRINRSKKPKIEINKSTNNCIEDAKDRNMISDVKISKTQTSHKPAPLVKIKNIKTISLGDNTASNKEMIGLNDVLEVITIPTVQLSPTLEYKLEKSTGLIENLDGFCAVANIVSGSGDGGEEEEDIDIDIENDDEMEDNPILKNRSTSPNSVYESLLKSAKVKTRSTKSSTISKNIEAVCLPDEEEVKDMEEESCDNLSAERMDSVMSVCSESSEDGLSEGGGSQSDSSQSVEKRIANMVVLFNGEVVEFPVPTEERVLEPDVITEEERKVHLEFFDGRPSKTPDRYLKIRNYILESWRKSSPSYLNKTSVRPGLKNCGDVNCIGRIHTYLECVGAINYGCEQSCYNHPVKVAAVGVKEKSSRDVLIKGFKLNSMRPRKRKTKDPYGNWINVNDLQGKTIEHQDNIYDGKMTKSFKGDTEKTNHYKDVKNFYDPFKLIPSDSFTDEKCAPFSVEIYNSCLVIMDVHAHVAKTEVIGMLGGQFSDGRLCITISIPCNSTSTGMQCEMDPVSQTQASEEIEKYGMSVVGWYHSHPTFEPNPSVRDIETQLKFQEWFSKGGSRFIGIIISPYSRLNTSLSSEIRCLTISDEIDPILMCNKPYKFEYDIIQHSIDTDAMISVIRQVAEKYSLYQNRVEMLGSYRSFTGHTCLSKMLMSIRELLFKQEQFCEFLNTIEDIFTEIFSLKEEIQTEEINNAFNVSLHKGTIDQQEVVPCTSSNEVNIEHKHSTDQQEVVQCTSSNEVNIEHKHTTGQQEVVPCTHSNEDKHTTDKQEVVQCTSLNEVNIEHKHTTDQLNDIKCTNSNEVSIEREHTRGQDLDLSST